MKLTAMHFLRVNHSSRQRRWIRGVIFKKPSGFEKLIEGVYYGKHQTMPEGKKEW